MQTNPRLALKVLKSMEEDFVQLEASLLNVQDEATRIILFKEAREKRLAVDLLKSYYQRIVIRQA
jgi:hypothetical protein